VNIAGVVDYLLEISIQAFSSLRDNRLRTILSITGVAIGITAVVAIGAVSRGGKFLIFSELETFGLKSIWISRDYKDKDPHRAINKGTGIDNADLAAISANCCPLVRRVTPVVSDGRLTLPIRIGDRYSDASIEGVGADYMTINNDSLVAGRGFRVDDDSRRRNVIVIGSQLQRDLFGEGRDPIGQDIRIGQYNFTVIGLLSDKDRGFLASIGSSANQNANSRILMPFLTMQKILARREINYLQAETMELGDAKAAGSQIIRVLTQNHGGKYAYRSQTMEQYVDTANRILRGVSLIGIVAASLSLLVGGIGIMSIMSTSVVERTREIGLRKAIGATRSDILLQFLMEAVFISVSGGVIGLVLGIAASFVLAAVTGFPLAPSWITVAVALCVSIVVGLFSGYYPARRAASMQPVEALRYE
jgi:putative ABC transport system permease protein